LLRSGLCDIGGFGVSREIKSRVWDIDQKRFISSNDERLFFEFETGQIYQNGSNIYENPELCSK
jgi:hypothetical protein